MVDVAVDSASLSPETGAIIDGARVFAANVPLIGPERVTTLIFDAVDGESSSDRGERGTEVEITADGVAEDAEYEVTLNSTPIPLGTFRSDTTGRLTATVTIPEEAELGSHHIVVTGPSAVGGLVEARIPFVVLPRASECTVRGTGGSDFLVGTPRVDVICGFGGHDLIFGLGSGDLIFGGSGRDTIFGGGGADQIDGGPGRDTIFAGGGDDQVTGSGGRDVVYGNSGADEIDGGAGRDRLLGGFGDDVIRGGDGRDTIHGGPGDDSIDGGAGRDSCSGGSGSDTIVDC